MTATELAGKEWRVFTRIDYTGAHWIVSDWNNHAVIAHCYNPDGKTKAEAIASLPKLVKALQFVLDNGENEYVESEIRVTLAALDHE